MSANLPAYLNMFPRAGVRLTVGNPDERALRSCWPFGSI
jgi:hypothetical protein